MREASMIEHEIQRYTTVAVVLHWVMVLLVVAMLCLGLTMTEMSRENPVRSELFMLHKSLGLSTLLVVVARLAWRLGHKPPPLPEQLPLWQRRLAAWNHGLLYLVLFAQPLTGYLSSSFSGYKTRFWGMPLPHWGWKAPDLNELFTTYHEMGYITLLVLIGLHVFGALWHAHRHREMRIMQRMLLGRRGR